MASWCQPAHLPPRATGHEERGPGRWPGAPAAERPLEAAWAHSAEARFNVARHAPAVGYGDRAPSPVSDLPGSGTQAVIGSGVLLGA